MFDIISLENELNKSQPELTIYSNGLGGFIVAGSLYIKNGNEILDSYNVNIQVPSNFPYAPPIVTETGNKIPRIPDRHINPDGSACLYVRDFEYEFLNEQTTFLEFFEKVIVQFFYIQTYFEFNKRFPFGEYKHGIDGIFQFYQEKIGIKDEKEFLKLMKVLKKKKLRSWYLCFCGSFLRSNCQHCNKIYGLHKSIKRKHIHSTYLDIHKYVSLGKKLP
jgi:hypothetical protein